MEDRPIYKTKKSGGMGRFVDYLVDKGISDKSIFEKLNMAKTTFMKKRVNVEDFTWKEINIIAAHLNFSVDEFIDKFLKNP